MKAQTFGLSLHCGHRAVIDSSLPQRNKHILRLALFPLAATVAYLPLEMSAALGGAVAGGTILLRWPWLIWVVMAAILPVSSGLKMGRLSLTDLLLALAIALWFVDGVRRRQVRQFHTAIALPLLLYCCTLLLSVWNARALGEAAAEVVKWLEVLLMLVIVPAMLPVRHAPLLVAGLLLGGVGQALLGLYQFFFRIGPEWFIILGRFMRASGSFDQPNPYAGYLGLTLPVAMSLALWSIVNFRDWISGVGAGTENWRWRHGRWLHFYVGATGLIGAGLLASWSRGGWLGALAGVGVAILLYSRWTMIAGGLTTLILFGLILLDSLHVSLIPAPIAARMADIPAYLGLTDILSQQVTDENFAVMERMAHWVAALRMWEQNPWLGIGPGNFTTLYPDVHLPRWDISLGHAHNIYLNCLAETGILGLLAYLLLWGSIVVWLFRCQRAQASVMIHKGCEEIRRYRPFMALRGASWNRALIVGVLGVVAHLSVHNFFDNLFVQGMYLHVGLWLTAVQIVAAGSNGEIVSASKE